MFYKLNANYRQFAFVCQTEPDRSGPTKLSENESAEEHIFNLIQHALRMFQTGQFSEEFTPLKYGFEQQQLRHVNQ